MNDYYIQHDRVMNYRKNRNSFVQIIGEHAVRLCTLTKDENTDSKRGLMSGWVDIHKLNNEWVHLVTQNDNPNSEFVQTTNNLIHGYSEALGDYVLDKASGPEWRKKLSHIVKTEAKFFEALGSSNINTSNQWVDYTGSVITMVNIMGKYGPNSESYYIAAANCIEKGIMLGNSLDLLFRKK